MRLSRVDEAVSRLAALPTGRGWSALDAVVTAGNGVPVWAAICVGLGGAGTRGRRAATEGMVAYVAASVASNVIIKPLVHRDRPGRWPRAGRRTKPTSSFPSSHAATAFAFSSAVIAAWPAAGGPLLVVPLGIAASRVHSRDHRVSEVAAGALLGAAVGVAVHAAWAGVERVGRRRDDRVTCPTMRTHPAMIAQAVATNRSSDPSPRRGTATSPT
jgi:undecaprenyl-diphosphatase